MTDNNTNDPLAQIVYIALPARLDHHIGGFRIDPSIRLPVELPRAGASLDPEELSWEMIISAMLKVLAYDPTHQHAEYYRDFVLAVKPEIIEELTTTAVIKARAGDLSLSEEIFLALSGLLPEDAGTKVNLAIVYDQRADACESADDAASAERYRSLSFETYKQALALDPRSPEVHLNAGQFYLKQKNLEKAVEHLSFYYENSNDERRREEVKKLLDEMRSHNAMDDIFKQAFDYIRMGKEQEGIVKIREFLKTNPDVWNAWFLLGWAYRRTGEYQEGKEAFLTALLKGPPHTDTLNELAICHMELSEYEESRERLEEALRLEPENVKIISNLGILSLKEEKPEEAERYFRIAHELDPEDQIALKYLRHLSDPE